MWSTRDSMKAITITSGQELNCRFGVYRHSDLIGMPFGTKVASRNKKGFVYVLRPTPELWTLSLPHRTQILYVADIAFIISWLGIKAGSVVVEAGTGSGSFSHSVARSIGSKGHLHTFEFHKVRMEAAQLEFAAHGMADRSTLKHRNVCKEGFDLSGVADAVFLDLPAPWEAIASAKAAMKVSKALRPLKMEPFSNHMLTRAIDRLEQKTQTTRICCFSPCMEQVLRTVSSLNEQGFTQITMYETLLRTMDVTSTTLETPKSLDGAIAKLKMSAVRKEEKRQKQMETSRLAYEAKMAPEGDGGAEDLSRGVEGDGPRGVKRKGVESAAEALVDDARELEGPALPTKRARHDQEPSTLASSSSASTSKAQEPIPHHSTPATVVVSAPTPISIPGNRISLCKPFAEQRGHTSYLTFAILLPSIYPESEETEASSGITSTSAMAMPEIVTNGHHASAGAGSISDTFVEAEDSSMAST
ncbi:tRNA (adenine-N(1)-)-methyltransferase catalytic subunit trm61 [Tulasnella sp. 330]|nr:tRNA (adenine-N(1)-)-methyltransferase catalytic subunit trm61 [Tulasnella sp. 330]